MRTVLEELRRVWLLTTGEEVRAAIREGRSHPGWGIDPHLRKGYLVALPLALLGMLLASFVFFRTRSFAAFFGAYLPVGLVACLVWLAVAARSRAKESSRTR